MTKADYLQMQVMNRFFDRLCNLTDGELMQRKQIEIERQGNLKRINDELNRRNREV